MYCQYCGERLDEGVRQCAACGRLAPVSGRGPWPALFLITLFALLVLGVVYAQAGGGATATTADQDREQEQAVLPANYELPAAFGDLGPRLIAAGAIDPEQFVANYDRAGRPLDEAQQAILREGSEEAITIDAGNAYFLLNFFWALGLANDNVLLTEGPMMTTSNGDPGRFASVGGWSLGQKPPGELYASTRVIDLTGEQQSRVEQVAYNVYRPCCDNHTAFADCNHGMALLGALQLMASQGATVDELYDAAKYVSAFWYPQQAHETAIFFQETMGLAYADVDPRIAVGREAFSGSGFQQVHQWLVANDALPQPSGSGNSCGV